jgi:hypothetical protein
MSVIDIPTAAPSSGLDLERHRAPYIRTVNEGNGERELAELLGPRWRYEWWEYPLPSGFSFVPDFWRPRRWKRQVELQVELTWLDMALAREQRRLETPGLPEEEVSRLAYNLQHLTERWERKQAKVKTAQELYGELYNVEFILVNHVDYLRLLAGDCVVRDLAA